METHDCWGTMKDDEGTMRNIHSETEKFFMKIFNMFSWLCYDVNIKKTFQFQRRSHMRYMMWYGLRHGQWPISAPANSVYHWFLMIHRTPKTRKWKSGEFFFHIQADFFLASYEWWENANFSAKSQNHEFFFFSCRFSHFPPGSALFGVHVTFDRTERRHGRVDWRRFHIAHIEIFRRNQD